MSSTSTLARPIAETSPQVQEMLEREEKKITALRILYLIGAIAILIYSAIVSDIDLVELLEGSSTMAEYISRYFPPNFAAWRFYLQDIIETIGLGVWGT